MVDSAVLVRGPATNQPIKRRSIEKPRPLRCDPDLVCLPEILKLIEEVDIALQSPDSRNDDRTKTKVQRLKESLRLNGSVVERNTKEVIDMMEITMKDACMDNRLDIITRLNLLEILELKINNWQADPSVTAMYRQKIAEAQLDIDMKKIGFNGDHEKQPQNCNNNTATAENNNILSIMNVKSSSVGADNSVCPAGNAIKMMVQQTGPLVGHKIGDVMLPDPCNGLMDPPDHCASLIIKGDRLLISSNNKDLVKSSKDVLLEFFSLLVEESCETEKQGPKLICYEKDELMRLSKSPLCKQAPVNWDKILDVLPQIAKKPTASSKHFLREMEGIRKQEANAALLRKM